MPGVGAAGDLGTPGGPWAVGNTYVAHPARPNWNRVRPLAEAAARVDRAAFCIVPLPPGALARSVTAQVCAHGGHLRDGSPAQREWAAVPPDSGGRTHDHLGPRLSGPRTGGEIGQDVHRVAAGHLKPGWGRTDE